MGHVSVLRLCEQFAGIDNLDKSSSEAIGEVHIFQAVDCTEEGAGNMKRQSYLSAFGFMCVGLEEGVDVCHTHDLCVCGIRRGNWCVSYT
jgi:hypothetical protein